MKNLTRNRWAPRPHVEVGKLPRGIAIRESSSTRRRRTLLLGSKKRKKKTFLGSKKKMATRTAVARVVAPHQPAWAAAVLARRMEGGRRVARYFSDGTGRVLSEEERAAESVYIQKMEREKLEKERRKADKDKADAAKRAAAAKGDKKGGEARPT